MLDGAGLLVVLSHECIGIGLISSLTTPVALINYSLSSHTLSQNHDDSHFPKFLIFQEKSHVKRFILDEKVAHGAIQDSSKRGMSLSSSGFDLSNHTILSPLFSKACTLPIHICHNT